MYNKSHHILSQISRFFLNTGKEYYRGDYMQLAAGLTYYGLFSLAPLVLIIVSIGGVFYSRDLVQGEVLGTIAHYIGADSRQLIESMMATAAASSYLGFSAIIGVLVLFYGSTTLFVHIQRALMTIYASHPDYPSTAHKVFMTRFFAIVFLLFLTILIFTLMAINVLIALFSTLAQSTLGELFSIMTLHTLNFFFTFGVVSIICATLYRIFAFGGITLGRAFIGGSIAAFLFIVVNYLLGLYVQFVEVGVLRGIAGSLVVMLLWMYSMANVFLFGALAARRKRVS